MMRAMQKIPTLFVRDWDGDRRYVTRDVTPGCEWVLKGEGFATRKYDGTCVMFDGMDWWARREVKAGKPLPPDFVLLEADHETAKAVGWEPIGQSSFARWHAEVVAERAPGADRYLARPGTFELYGPKINGNPEGADSHRLVRHVDALTLPDAPRDFDGLAAWLHAHPYEGIVWHYWRAGEPIFAKIKKRDFPAPRGTC